MCDDLKRVKKSGKKPPYSIYDIARIYDMAVNTVKIIGSREHRYRVPEEKESEIEGRSPSVQSPYSVEYERRKAKRIRMSIARIKALQKNREEK